MGRNGYRHYQIRLVSDRHDFFEWCKIMLPVAHVEEASTERDDYERKSGNVLSSNDTPEIRQVRFGTLRPAQKEIIEKVEKQNDRQISIFYDPTGNHGKSWFTIHLWEKRDCFVVPRSDATAGKLSAFICSSYRWERFIIIDLPRASTADAGLYECLEDTKDGLVFDHRWQGKTRNIRGAKLIVLTNSPINPDLLSWDRLDMYKWANDHWDSVQVNEMRSMYEYVQEKKAAKKSRKKSGGKTPRNPPN